MLARFNSSGLNQQRGVTLIEVLIAVVVLSIGVLGLAALQVTTLRSNAEAYQRSQATNLGYQVLDELRVNRIAVLAAGDTTAEQKETWDDMASAILPAGDVTVTVVAGAATVDLTWVDDRSQSGDDRLVTFSLVSRI